MGSHQAFQIADGKVRAVDDQIRPRAQGIQQQMLLADSVGDGPVLGQRMPPAGFGEAPLKGLVGAGEEDELYVQSWLPAKALYPLDDRLDGEAPGPAVDADGKRPIEAFRGTQKSKRKIVHGLVTQILQRSKGRAAAGPR